jgi:putative hemolysin
VVANHRYGVLDGIVLACLIGRVRGDLRILANSVLLRAPEMQDVMLPIDFGLGAEAVRTNLASRAAAEDWLESGGCVLVFPGGGVSTVPRPFDRVAVDAEWHPFVARLIQRAHAPMLTVFFAGQNSRLFQIASHVSLTLRLSLLFKEVADRIGGDLRIAIGAPLPFAQLAPLAERRALMAELRRRTYALVRDLPSNPRPGAAWRDSSASRAPAA